MAKRYIGDAIITIQYRDRGDYAGTIRAGGHTWHFEDLYAPAGGLPFAYDSPEAYDKMAAAAVSFGSYYTTHNRGSDTPEWAPPAEVADAIEEATAWATDEEGKGLYEVRRSPGGQGRFRENPRRPPKKWMRDCIRGVKESGTAKNPGAVCGALWYHKMSPSQRHEALRRRESRALTNPRKPKSYAHLKILWSPVSQRWLVLWPGHGRLEDQQVLDSFDHLDEAERYADRISGRVSDGAVLANPTGPDYKAGYEEGKRDAKRGIDPRHGKWEKTHFAVGYVHGYRDGMRSTGEFPPAKFPSALANPTGAEVAAIVAGAALVGGLLYLLFRPKEAQAAPVSPTPTPTPAPAPGTSPAPSPGAAPAPTTAPTTATGSLCPLTSDQLNAFGAARGYKILFNVNTMTQAPTSAPYTTDSTWRMFLFQTCSLYSWQVNEWVHDLPADAELASWLAVQGLKMPSKYVHGIPESSCSAFLP